MNQKHFGGIFSFFLSSRTLLLANWLCHVRVFEEIGPMKKFTVLSVLLYADSAVSEADLSFMNLEGDPFG